MNESISDQRRRRWPSTDRWDNDYEKGRSIVYKSVYEVGVLLSSEPCKNIMFSYLNWSLYQVRTYRRYACEGRLTCKPPSPCSDNLFSYLNRAS